VEEQVFTFQGSRPDVVVELRDDRWAEPERPMFLVLRVFANDEPALGSVRRTAELLHDAGGGHYTRGPIKILDP
jgi:hypothetical protein